MAQFHVERLAPDSADPESPSADFEICRMIRLEVFIEGQAIAREEEFDGLDAEALHFIAFEGGSLDVDSIHARHDRLSSAALGTARMRIVEGAAKAERMAVRERARRRGVGRALLQAIESAAREMEQPFVWLNAQIQAIPFYEKLGYRVEGGVFVEAEIDHRRMTKPLSRPPTSHGGSASG